VLSSEMHSLVTSDQLKLRLRVRYLIVFATDSSIR
jgi:hypothetical protein